MNHDPKLASQLLDVYNGLVDKRVPWEALWRDLANHIMPRKQGGTRYQTTANVSREARLYDTTAIHANNVLASGQLSWMTPHTGDWFVLKAPETLANSDGCKSYYADCTKIIRDVLSSRSNFYTVAHEFFSDRSGFGTATMHCEKGKRYAINFTVYPIGSYAIAEDDEGYVDTVYRELELTARQATLKFGDSCPPKIKEAMEKGGASVNEKFKFVHAVYPRPESEIKPGVMTPDNKPIASVYIEVGSKTVVEVGGYDEMPTMVSRYLEWSNGLGGVYGWSPSWAALPEARQVNLLQMWMDALAHKAALPPMLEPASMEGELDLSAGARNPIDDQLMREGIMPKPLQVVGDFQSGLQRIEERQKAIRKHFHVDLFEMFGEQSKEMTATEVNARLREKVIQISPSFARLTTELLNPLIRRVYSICLELGLLPEPPGELVQPVPTHDGSPSTLGVIPTPAITYSSRMQIELLSLANAAKEKVLQNLAMVSQFDPQAVDNFDFDKMIRNDARDNGLPSEELRSEEEREAMRQAKAQAMQQQQQMAQMESASKMAANVGKIDPTNLEKLKGVAA